LLLLLLGWSERSTLHPSPVLRTRSAIYRR
jgi:hypothetical protein